MEKTAELRNGEYLYRFSLSDDGKKLTAERYDFGERTVDGTKRKPQWIIVWVRSL